MQNSRSFPGEESCCQESSPNLKRDWAGSWLIRPKKGRRKLSSDFPGVSTNIGTGGVTQVRQEDCFEVETASIELLELATLEIIREGSNGIHYANVVGPSGFGSETEELRNVN